jgi:hypothetical protein
LGRSGEKHLDRVSKRWSTLLSIVSGYVLVLHERVEWRRRDVALPVERRMAGERDPVDRGADVCT